MSGKRTDIALGLVLLVGLIAGLNCQTEQSRHFGLDDISIDRLLKDAPEATYPRLEDEDDDIAVPKYRFKPIEPERTFGESDVGEYEPSNNRNIDYDDVNGYEPRTTTETVTTDAGDGAEVVTARDDVTDGTATTVDATEAAQEATAVDNDVYRTKDNEDGRMVESTKTETTTSTQMTTTRTVEEFTSKQTPEDLETSQRIPKADTDQHTMMETRPYEMKPRPTAAVDRSTALRSWLEDTWLRPPAGILVPLRPMALNRALAVWDDLNSSTQLNISDIVVVGYDANGVNWRSRHNLQGSSGAKTVSEALAKLLQKYNGVSTETNGDGAMRALASAAKVVPYDSALFVITDRGAGDGTRLPLALRALVEKRLKVYTVWTDPAYPSAESERALQDLKNISKHTEGDVLPYSLHVPDIPGSNNMAAEVDWDAKKAQPRRARVGFLGEAENFDTLLVRRGGGGAISLGVPIENGITALKFFIEGAVEHAVLYPPNEGPQIDLYNVTSVMAFSSGSRTEALSPRDVLLLFPGAKADDDKLSVLPAAKSEPSAPAPTVGLWHLSVRCDTCDYRLIVGARALIHFETDTEYKDILKLRITGPVSSVRESVLIDEYGTELAKLSYSYQPTDGQVENMDGTTTELLAEVVLPNVKGAKVYAKIVGRDNRGEPFVRLSGPLNLNQQEARTIRTTHQNLELEEMDRSSRLQYNDTNVLPNNRATSQVVNQRGNLLTAVQIGLGTRLYGAPGDNLQLHFEVTNYREQAVSFQFEAVGELRFLRGISPSRQTVAAGQTQNVIVSVGITATAQPGARDLITFTAYGLDQVSISTYVYVVNSVEAIADTWAPEIRHNFQGSCLGRMGSDCAQHIWSASIIARDQITGLLRITSTPIGLVYDSNFISGTREEVISTYRATCCAPRLSVTAIDAFGNANSYIIDISNYYTEAAIAAIALGVLLLIAIIALIVFLIWWCVKRRKESRELPSYTTRNN